MAASLLKRFASICGLVLVLAGCATRSVELPPPPPAQRTGPSIATRGFPATFDAAELPEWNDRVFYEIFIRSFRDSDGDGVGDIRGIIDSFDYLNDGDPSTETDLGVTGLWLMPFNPSPSYHGYDVTDYYDVDPEYGSLADLRELIALAESRGVVVLMDLVLNHTSSDHPWFQAALGGDPVFRDFYRFVDGDAPDQTGPWGQTVWHRAPGGGSYYGLFWSGMPDLNYANPRVTAEMVRVVDFWLLDVGIHGFRLDAIMYLVESGAQMMNTGETLRWFDDFSAHVTAVAPDALTVGEVWLDTATVARYVPDRVNIAFEFDLADAMVAAVRTGRAEPILRAQELVLDQLPRGQYGRFLTNHDQPRVATQIGVGTRELALAAGLLLTGPGVPFLYYGEEIGLTGPKPDEEIRRPMHWTPDGGFTAGTPWRGYGEALAERNVALQTADPQSLLSVYRSLIHLRTGSEALQRGALIHVPSGSSRLYAFIRWAGDDAMLVLHNLGRTLTSVEYGLSLDRSPFTGRMTLEEVWRSPWAESAPTPPPIVLADGGFNDVQPLPIIGAQETRVFRIRAQ